MKTFVTVGLERKPFSRLLKFVDHAVQCNVLSPDTLVQCGHTNFPAHSFKTVDFLPFASMVAAIEDAELVITHAGVGSILLCLNAGKIPLVVPREGRLCEHVDNHQVEFAEVMAAAGKVKTAYNEEDFFLLLHQAEQWHSKLSPISNQDLELELVNSLNTLLKEHSKP